MAIETEDTTDPQNLVPLQGYPGYQEHQTCVWCGAEVTIKEVIWESHNAKRVSLRCKGCNDIEVSTKKKQMFRRVIPIKK